MKTIATLALIMALLGLPAVNATADTFTLWDKFPQTINGENGFGTAGVTHDPDTLFPLIYSANTGDYYFSADGAGALPVVQRVTYPQILLQPSATETAVYYGIPPETDIINVTGQFDLANGATAAHVDVGTAWINPSDPTHPVYNSLFSADLTTDPGHPLLTASFYLSNVIVDPTHALAFSVDQGSSDAQAYLQGTITSVPVPAPLVLLGSGLLGLAGWRRLRKS